MYFNLLEHLDSVDDVLDTHALVDVGAELGGGEHVLQRVVAM